VISKNILSAEGNITETENQLKVEGKLTIAPPDQPDIVLESADLTVEYNDDNSVKSMQGTANVPTVLNYMEITEPVQADVGYYSGMYLNENWDLEIQLPNDRQYMAFMFAVALEMKVGANSDPEATKPISIKPPVGRYLIYLFDYTDPMVYISAAQDSLGGFGFGESLEGNIPYFPLQPANEIVAFDDGKSFRSGSFPLFKVIEVSGTMVQANNFNAKLTEDDPLPVSFTAGYKAGINGTFEFSLPIKGWVSFEIPMGEASAAIVAEAGTDGVEAKAFITGLNKPDNSWWPEFIPVKPGAQTRTTGYVKQNGEFDLELSGTYSLEIPDNTYAIDGLMGATNEAFTLTGGVLANDIR